MLKYLNTYFEHSRAENEIDILSEIFIKPNQFVQAINPPEREMSIIVANKGVGKSSIVNYLAIQSGTSKIPVVLITPTDIMNEDLAGTSNHALFRKKIYESLLLSISSKLIENHSSLISEFQRHLYNSAIENGNEKPDFINKLSNFLLPLGNLVTGLNFNALIPNTMPNYRQLLAAIKENIEKTERVFYLCVDDTDQLANADDPSFLQKIWFGILAIGDVARKFENIKCIVTLRREIWERIINDEPSKRDQLDHFRDMVVDIKSDDAYVQSVLEKRLAAALEQENRLEKDKKYDSFKNYFEDKEVILPTSTETRNWCDFIVKNSRCRPRDTVQFIKALVKSAQTDSRDIISQRDVDKIDEKYSEERKNDLVNENEVACRALDDIIRRFKNVGFEMKGSDLFNFLKNFEGVGYRVAVYSRAINFTKDEDVIFLWDFLRKISFLTPRILDKSERKGYRHMMPYEDEMLVCVQRKSEILNMTWDVHPVFRSYLMSLRNKDREQKIAKKRPDAKEIKGKKIKRRRPTV
jgi:hypothetical protein